MHILKFQRRRRRRNLLVTNCFQIPYEFKVNFWHLLENWIDLYAVIDARKFIMWLETTDNNLQHMYITLDSSIHIMKQHKCRSSNNHKRSQSNRWCLWLPLQLEMRKSRIPIQSFWIVVGNKVFNSGFTVCWRIFVRQ